MAKRREQLEETARVLRSRLEELEARRVDEHDRPIHNVALMAVRTTLTEVGRQLARLHEGRVALG